MQQPEADMDMGKLFIALAATAAAVFAIGRIRASAGKRGGLVPPSAVGRDGAQLSDLRARLDEHEAFYSGSLGEPTGLLLAPRADGSRLELDNRWKPVADPAEIDRLADRIGARGGRLLAAATPESDAGRRSLLAWVYTFGHTAPRPGKTPGAWTMAPPSALLQQDDRK